MTVFTRTLAVLAPLIAGVLLLSLAGCSSEESSGQGLTARTQAGETAFNANCALCHGLNAAGTTQGPTLIHRVYEPNHHQDFAFRNAMRKGVPSHHWQFGDMPPVPGLSDEEVDSIICYVRELQREGGIIGADAPATWC